MAGTQARYDVLVIGGGTAGLCAAISARSAGARVLLAEAAPRTARGGNTRHSRNFRIAHDKPSRFFPGRYGQDDFIAQINRVAEGQNDPALTRLLVQQSADLPIWLENLGVIFQTTASPTLPWSKRTAFFLGGGMTMLNQLYRVAETLGIEIAYDHPISGLEIRDTHAEALCDNKPSGARAVIACCGGYQANPVWLRDDLGAKADTLINRGTPYGQGEVLKSLFRHGAQAAGQPGTCHLVAVDGRSPDHDGGILTRADSISWGIVVDRQGQRFHDEGGDTGPTRYAVWGRKVMGLPDGKAFSILDAAALRRAPPSIFPAIQAETVEVLAVKLGLPSAPLQDSINRFNQAVVAKSERTEGVVPPKSQRAFALTEPPFSAYPVRPGITFTCHGVKVDDKAHVLFQENRIIPNLFAAGMIMTPNILGSGYLAGAAMTVGAVFGRIAGQEAAAYALA